MAKLLKQDLEDNGVDVGEDTSNSLQELIMNYNNDDVLAAFQPDTFGHLFWQQQKEMLKKGDARGNRWHPMMIKWCINL